MLVKRRMHIVVALSTSCALIAFAVYQRHHPVAIPPVVFFVAAAIISLLDVVYGILRHKSCRSAR